MPPPDSARRPLPLQRVPLERWRSVRGVLTDIDDTLTRDGAIEPAARAALRRLRSAGIPVLAVTGRPMGWSEPLVRDGTLQAIVAENGAGAWFLGADGKPHVEFVQDEPTRAGHARRLSAVAQTILREVPGAKLARDSAGRATDIAIDHGEFAQLDATAIARVVAIMRDAGMTATVSSIHVNGWFGAHDKVSGARWIVQRLLGRDLDAERDAWVYVGDSTNDQEMFAYFVFSVGVANLLRFADALAVWPAYLTESERGAGFAEVAQALLAVQPRAEGFDTSGRT